MSLAEELQKEVFRLQDEITALNTQLNIVLHKLAAIQKHTGENATWHDCDAEMKRIREWMIRRGREK